MKEETLEFAASYTITPRFKNLVKWLHENDIKFYTYQLKTERPFKVVIKKCHGLTNVEEIKTASNNIDHDVRNVANIQHCTKEPLLLFFVDLEPKDNNKTFMS